MKKEPICYYVTEYPRFENDLQVRSGQLSVKNKCDYIISTLNEIGYKVIVLSDSRYTGNQFASPGKIRRLNIKTKLVEFWCFKTEWSVFKYIKNRCCKIQMYLYMLFKMSKGDNLIVYHDYAYAKAIRLIQRIKHFNLILEIEDIYHEVWKIKKRFVQAEISILKENYKSIVVSETMKSILNKSNALVSYGSYKIYKGNIEKNRNKDRIVIVCTGSFDMNRGTGVLALDTIEMLPEKYLLYMSGVVREDSKEIISNRIKEINKNAGFEKCKFLGMLGKDDYEKLLLSADIGLNTQIEGDYSSYIFPSKLIKYLSYNLDVVTTPGDSIINSSLNSCFNITEGYLPEEIARCILGIDIGKHEDYRNVLKKLHEEYKSGLKQLIE